MRALTFLARRFVAGETPEAAIAVGQRLKAKGIRATFDQLGEDVKDREAAIRSAQANKRLLGLIPDGMEKNVSIKLTVLGLDISRDFCLEQVASVIEVARGVGGFVRIDIEGSKHTQATVEVFHELRKTFDNVGMALQAYLHRTEDDVKEAVSRGDRVRLCKGAYAEPPEVALKKMDDIRANFRKCAHLLLDRGNYPALATHDESLIQDSLDYARANRIPADRFEFQMLYGLRPKRWEQLVASGNNLRVYVPYGTHWFPYFYRRLRERKENVFFVLKGILRG
ncbi:MAG TPA: proline dehydrogenase family protein [Vicinamibacteria bacterium]|nr:proline dehydrogenase family protein [Vicinamibacteria bacterium]